MKADLIQAHYDTLANIAARELRSILVLLLLAACLGATAQAQSSQPTMTILRAVPAGPGPNGGMLLDIYFTMRDRDNHPMDGQQIETARITLGNAAIDASAVEPASSPIKIALLLDASGSMEPFMADVRKAAADAVQRAPANAGLAVFAFANLPNDQLFAPIGTGQADGFNNDKQLVASDINSANAVPGGPTCLYNAAYKALEYLDAHVRPESGARTAIILFTDGKDERAKTDGPCSQRTLSDVLQRAKGAQLVPIHTIGFCSAADCKNIDRPTLEQMAFSTGGFSVAGQQSDLGQLFSQIIDGLKSQWVAHVEVFPSQGLQQATLNVTVAGETAPIAGGLTFTSPNDWSGKPSFALTLDYQRDQDLYIATVKIENPRTVQSITARVFDKKRGVYVSDAEAHYEAAKLPPQFEIATASLEAQREYCFQIEATDVNGSPITTDKGSATLDEKCGTYEPELALSVDAYKADYSANTLLVNFGILGAGKRVLQIEGDISDAKSSEPLGPIARSVLQPGQQQISVSLPPRLRELADGQREFRVGLRLITSDGQVIQPSAIKPFVPPAAPRRGFIDTLTSMFSSPIVLISLLAIMVIASAALLYARRTRGGVPAIADPGPYAPPTMMLGQTADDVTLPYAADLDQLTERLQPDTPTLALRVLRTVDSSQIRRALLTSFPCVIGRGSKVSGFHIGGDSDISRAHIQITHSKDGFCIIDQSANGTKIGEMPLEPNTPIRITGRMIVGLSPRTTIELEPLVTGPTR